MADITRRLGWRHLRGAPTAHIRHHRGGTLLHDGPGLSFWFRALTAALSEVLVDGVAAVRERVAAGLDAEPRLPATGIEVVAVRVMALRPEPEVERALRTPAREQIQQEADRATYERRAVAVERERAIAENELASRIELARREEQLVEQRGTNARREA